MIHQLLRFQQRIHLKVQYITDCQRMLKRRIFRKKHKVNIFSLNISFVCTTYTLVHCRLCKQKKRSRYKTLKILRHCFLLCCLGICNTPWCRLPPPPQSQEKQILIHLFLVIAVGPEKKDLPFLRFGKREDDGKLFKIVFILNSIK